MKPRTICFWALLAGALAGLTYLSRFRPTTPDRPRDLDAMFLPAAGNVWREGNNPYDYAIFKRQRVTFGASQFDCNFAYAPTVAAPAILASFASPQCWSKILACINVAAALLGGVCLVLAARPSERPGETGSDWDVESSWPAFLIVASPGTVANLHTGQTTLIPIALALLSSCLMQRRRDVLAGVALAAATFKISLVAGVVAWLGLRPARRRRTLFAFVVTSLALAAPAFVSVGIGGTVLGWLEALAEYVAIPHNSPSYPNSFGLPAVLASFEIPHQWTPVLAVASLAWLWSRRAAMTEFEQFAVALAAPVLFVLSHLYDSVALAPLTLATIRAARAPLARCTCWTLAILQMLPPSVLLLLHVSLVSVWRSTAGMVALLVLVVLVEIRNREPALRNGAEGAVRVGEVERESIAIDDEVSRPRQ